MATNIAEESKTPYVFLGRSGLKVSNISLGTMTFGENQNGRPGKSDKDLSHQIINRYVEWVGNFLDTADVYRRDNSETIIVEETLRTLDDLVRAGKIRYIGLSNVTGWQLSQLVETTKHLGLNPIISLQAWTALLCPHYWSPESDCGHLVSRESEVEPFQVCKAQGLGVLPWSPLKGGFLTGKVKRGQKPTEGRIGWVSDNETKAMQSAPLRKSFEEKSFDVLEVVEAIAKNHSKGVPQVAIPCLLQKDVVSSVIIGARTLAQLDDNIGANGWSLTQQEMKQLDDVSAPTLTYPYNMVFSNNPNRLNPAANDFYVKSTSN